ncbi:hypothetical protein [Phenylobacterium immobile]|uniref:hypothetical protein n=1 Tax=Phenylobacterium immobile TaxID=21 RepID=UPI000AB76A2F|nr:hypothetical protein [Phenylobacterium immobile]
MPAAARKMKPEELVGAAVIAALEDANGDMNKAADMLQIAVDQSPTLRSALLEPWVAQACREAIRRHLQDVRREVWTGTKSHTAGASKPEVMAEQRARVVQLAAGTLLMFPLPGGRRLGEATREEVGAAAEFYSRQSADMGTKARWLRLIGQSLPDGKRVSDVLSDRRLEELQLEATHASD